MKVIRNILRWIRSLFAKEREYLYREIYDTETNMED